MATIKQSPNSSATATFAILDQLSRFGLVLFSLAIVAVGVETMACAHVVSGRYQVVPVIPWLPSIPAIAYAVGTIWVLCGVGLHFRRTAVVSSLTLGTLMLLFALGLDAPKSPNFMSAGWRTAVLEPLAIASLAWLVPGPDAVSTSLYRTSRYLLALALIVFGIAHFQVLTFVATLLPTWIPWNRFWTVFFGVAFIAAGASFASGYRQRWAATGVGLMFAIWVVTLHLPRTLGLYAIPGAIRNPDEWSSLFIAIALWGGSWAIARNLPITRQFEEASGV